MATAHLHGLAPDGSWKPLLVNSQGAFLTAPNSWTYVAASGGITDTSDVTLVAAAGVGSVNYITALQYHNKDASVGTEVVLKSGSTVLWRGFAPANMVSSVSVHFPLPIATAPNVALTAAAITTSAELYINAQGYQDKSVSQISAGLTALEEIYDDDGDILYSDSNAQLYM